MILVTKSLNYGKLSKMKITYILQKQDGICLFKDLLSKIAQIYKI